MALPDYLPVPNAPLIADDPARDAIWRRWLEQLKNRIQPLNVGTVTSINVSSLLSGITPSGGPVTSAGIITLAGILNVSSGGSGTSTLTGYLIGNGTNAFTATSAIHTSTITGILPVSSGGTGVSVLTSTYVPYGDGTNPFLSTADLTYTASSSTFAAVRVSVPDGTAALPSIKIGDEQNGLFSPGVNQIGFGVNGFQRATLGTGAFDYLLSSAGNTLRIGVSNLSNTANSSSEKRATVAGTSAGDPFSSYIITSGSSWSSGADNSDSDSYKISQNATLGTNDFLVITTAGLTSLSSVSTAGNATVGGALVVTSSATLGSVSTIGNTVMGATTSATFVTNTTSWTLNNGVTVTGTWTNLGTVSTVDINGGTIDAAAIGSATASNAVFTNVSTTTLFSTSTATLPLVNIDGGNIDSTAIGAATASTGVFTNVSTTSFFTSTSVFWNVSTTTLFSTSTATLPLVNIDGGNIDSTAIGANTASTGTFTSVSSATVYGTSSVASPNFFYEGVGLNDDQAGYWSFSAADSRGVVVVSGNTDSAGSAMVAFRVGSAIFCRALASGISAGAVATTTGALTGTTGTNGNLTFSTTSTGTGDRLYIENRTGATRGYVATYLSLTIGIPTSFTTV